MQTQHTEPTQSLRAVPPTAATVRSPFRRQLDTSIVIEQLAQLLCDAHLAASGLQSAPAWDDISPIVRDTYRAQAIAALCRLQRPVTLLAQAQVRREFGPQGLAAVQAYDALLTRHAPAVSGITGGTAA
jgi:hypothetical protein